MSKYKEQNLSDIRTISIVERQSKVRVDQILDPRSGLADQSGRFRDALSSIFPNILKGEDLRRVVAEIRSARDQGKEILWLMGAHVIKCGLSLYLKTLMKNGYVTALATTGSATVHDLELAFFGETSEDVAAELPLGRFGMAVETATHFNRACELGTRENLGLGEAIGAYVKSEPCPHGNASVFGSAYRSSIPATVHVALGTDIVHQHPSFQGSAVGELSMRDFRIFTSSVGRLFDRGVVIVFGSAVILPEVFLKAVSIGYNVGRKADSVTAVNFDMNANYRVKENVLLRPFQGNGQSYSFHGHHEIMLPLLFHLLADNR